MANPAIAEVVVLTPLEKTLHYLIPTPIHPLPHRGSRVIVPLGRRESMGLVLDIHEANAEAPSSPPLRPLVSVLDEHPVMSAELLSLCRWMWAPYCRP